MDHLTGVIPVLVTEIQQRRVHGAGDGTEREAAMVFSRCKRTAAGSPLKRG
jgi:hypothetical protein